MSSSHLFLLNKPNKINTSSDYSDTDSNYSISTNTSDSDHSNKSNKSNKSSNSECYNLENKEIKIEFIGGSESNLTCDTPFINFLMKKRMVSCKLGPSTHIAAFIPELKKKQYLICTNRKDRDR